MDWHPLTAGDAPPLAVTPKASAESTPTLEHDLERPPTAARSLKLPCAPHAMSSQQLQVYLVNALSSEAAPALLPADLVALLVQSLSARLERALAAKDRQRAIGTAQVAALTDLIREHSSASVSDQLIQRTLLRARAIPKQPRGDPPDRPWELSFGLDQPPAPDEEEEEEVFELPRRPPNVDAALDEAMSDTAFDVRSESSLSLPAELPLPDHHPGARHMSIAARLLGLGKHGESSGRQRSPDAAAPPALEGEGPPKSRTSIQGWAAGVFSGPSSIKTDAESTKEKPLKRSDSNASLASSSSHSTTLGTSISSHPIDSQQASSMTSPPPSIAPSNKASAVTALISKKKGSAVLSASVLAVPALSNPGSVQGSPLLSTFPSNSSRRSSASLSALDAVPERSDSAKELVGVPSDLTSGPVSRAMSTTSLASSTAEDEEAAPRTSGFSRYLGFIGNASKASPPVTLPTVGLAASKPIFQPAMTAPAFTSNTAASASAGANAAASTVELTAIVAPESRPPAFTSAPDPQGMGQLIDRYGFLHEKNGMKIYRELRQRQQDKGDAASGKDVALEEAPEADVEGVNSLKRLVAQLDEMNAGQEKAQVARWDEFLKKRRTKGTQPVYESSPARKERNNSANSQGGAALATTEATAGEEDLWTDNIIGIARMGVSGKAGKEAWRDFKKLVRTGIPISYRGAVWSELSGATEAKEPGYFEELLQRHEGGDSLCLKQINADVGRTFGSNIYFGGDGPGVAKLRRILVAYSWHNPEVGYCQGMNLLAGTLLLALPTEEDAFWILCCVIERILPSDYFTPSLLVSRADQRVLKALVARHLPTLNAHLEDLGVELEAVTFGWFLSLFSLPLPIRTLLRVFDMFFCDGAIVLFRVALAILQLNSAEILAIDSASELYVHLRTMTASLHQADKLISAACEFRVKSKEIIALREQFVQELMPPVSGP